MLSNVRDLSGRYDAWICDIWGVLHNGVVAHPAPVEAVEAFRRAGGTVVLVTNAPRPHTSVEEQLLRLGIGRHAYDAVITSGDVTRQLLQDLGDAAVLHIGPERDMPIFAGMPLRRTAAEQATAIVCTGLFNDTRETAADYRERLEILVKRGLPMICANPDLTVDRGGVIIPCAGSLAELYETLGGTVTYAGKPHLPIYDRSIAAIAALRERAVDRSRILCVGDGVNTDIKGAHTAGLDALYIASAIHLDGPPTDDAIAELFRATSHRPIAAQAVLTW